MSPTQDQISAMLGRNLAENEPQNPLEENLRRAESKKNPRNMKLQEWEKEFLNAQSESLSWEEYKKNVLDEANIREDEREQREKDNPYLQDPRKDIEHIESRPDSFETPEALQRAVQRLLTYALKLKSDFRKEWEDDSKNPKVSNDPSEKKRQYDVAIDRIADLMNAAKGKDVNSPEAQALKSEMKTLAGFIKNFYSEGREFEIGAFQKVRSMKELGKLIMEGAEERFKTGGEKEIVDKDGKFHPENFEAWVRSELVDLATNINPNDPINAFNMIHAQTAFREISFMNMYRNLSYWRDEEEKEDKATEEDVRSGVKDQYNKTVQVGQVFKRITYKENKEYLALRDHLANELFMFGYLHEFDVDLRLNKGGEENVPKIVAKHSMKNTLTEKRSRMLFLLKLNSTAKNKSTSELELQEVLENKEMLNVGTVGKALRRALLAYYYIGEIGARPEQLSKDPQGNPNNMFEKILGKEGTDEFYRGIIRHIIEDKGIAELKERIAKMKNQQNVQQLAQSKLDILTKVMDKDERKKQGKSADWLDEILNNHKGELALIFQWAGVADAEASDFARGNLSWKAHAAKLLQKEWQMEGDGSYKTLAKLNLFSQRNAESQNIKILRDAMIEALMKTEELDKDDASYAELMANDMWYTMGISGRNDLSGTAFDAWSKVINFMRYRLKQSDGRLYPGNIYNMFGIKRIGLTPMEAWEVKRKDGSRTNLLEQLQGGEGSDFNFDHFEDFDFEGDAQAHFANDHMGNGYRMYHWLLEDDLAWADFFTWEKGVLKFNMKAANDIMDDKYHTIRYCYDNIGPHYEKIVRSVEYRYNSDTKEYEAYFTDESLLESTFDEELRNMGMYERPELADDKGKRVSRNVFAYILSKEIYAHTKWNSPKEKWGDEHIALLQDFLRKMAVGGFYQDRFGQVKQIAKFFNWHELSIIKEHGGRGWLYKLRTTGGQTILLPFEVMLAIAGATYHVAKPSGLEINLPGVEAIFGRVA